MDLNDGLYHTTSSPFNVIPTSSFQSHSTNRWRLTKRKIAFFPPFSFQVALVTQQVMSRNNRHPQHSLHLSQRILPSFNLCQLSSSHRAPCMKYYKHCEILPWRHWFLILILYRIKKSCEKTQLKLGCAFTSTKKTAFQGQEMPNCKEMSYSKTAVRTTVMEDSLN